MNRLFYTALTALALAGCSPKSEICGTYNGLLPAADGPGIDMTLQLNANNTFVNKLVYVGQKDGTFYEKGTYDINGSIIKLDGRDFRVDHVNFMFKSVSLQDMDLTNSGQPIFRSEGLPHIRELYEQ